MAAVNPAHAEEPPRDAHVSIQIVLLHHLLTADGTPPADRWLAFRELPDGLFYAQAFAGHAEGLLAEKLGANLAGFRRAAESLGGSSARSGERSLSLSGVPTPRRGCAALGGR